MSSLYFKIRKNESWPDWALCTQQHFPCPKYNADIARYSDVFSRVRRSYSLKAKISENVGIFVLALKRKKVFFRFVRMQAKHSKQRKKFKRN